MNLPINEIIHSDSLNALKKLPTGCVHLGVTSPPYWNQRLYSWGGNGFCEREAKRKKKKKVEHKWDRADPIMTCKKCGMHAPILGLEDTPEEHIEKLVEIFREFKRVLRDDGVLFVNYGNKYASCKSRYSQREQTIRGKSCDDVFEGNKADFYKTGQYQDGDLIGLPWRLAFAMQKDGWILRSDVIWAKALSFGAHDCPYCGKPLYQSIGGGEDLFGDCIEPEIINHKKSGSTMPNSVNGWRWERCRVKVKSGGRSKSTGQHKGLVPENGMTGRNPDSCRNPDLQTQWIDCPGCPKCEPNGGYVLRRGSWRPTTAHEYLLMFVKQSGYYCDMEAVREEGCNTPWHPTKGWREGNIDNNHNPAEYSNDNEKSGRNLRDVFCINPQAYSEAHYATFPEALVEPLIRVGTSEKGCCPKCGSQWARVVDSKQVKRERPSDRTDRHNQGGGVNSCGNTVAGVNTTTLGWRATCKCGLEPVPSIVMDMFAGSGTTLAVAARLNRNYLGIEINPEYINNQAVYRVAEGETGLSVKEQIAGQGGLFE